MTFRFIKSDIERYRVNEFGKQDAKPDGLQKEMPEQASDSFIKSLIVYHESDDEIKIKKYNRKPKAFNLDFLTDMQRKVFIRFFFDKGVYYVGESGKKGSQSSLCNNISCP